MNSLSAISLTTFETRLPFLHPCLFRQKPRHALDAAKTSVGWRTVRHNSVEADEDGTHGFPDTHLNPAPSSYSHTPFTDKCTITLSSGSGGHGCVSFLREKYIADGPPNGGDGGDGGSVYIQAVRGETSLHRLARKGVANAGRGRNGRGKGQGGEKGADVCITVPVGTVVKEMRRNTPEGAAGGHTAEDALAVTQQRRKRSAPDSAWITYPGMSKAEAMLKRPPPVPRKRQSITQALQPPHPIKLDLDSPMDTPMLIAAGAVGGLGNVHFISRDDARPKFATRGESGMNVTLELELKMLADVGLVGLPNAGKSTLLRALSNSRTRVGDWAFTTLQPTIGTVVLDDHKGRPFHRAHLKSGEPRTSFSVADIPGLIEDSHQDRGLGLGFLRHVERAGILAFVIDLSAGDAVLALQALWREVGEYERLRGRQVNAETESHMHEERLEGGAVLPLPALSPPISSKPWFVVATKADLPATQDNFQNLQRYVDSVGQGLLTHPNGRPNAWRKNLVTVPVSAINAEGVERIPGLVLELLD